MPVEVKLRKGEAMEKALRRLKKKLDREGVIRDIRQKRYFEKPSEIKRRKKKVAAFNNMLRQRYENCSQLLFKNRTFKSGFFHFLKQRDFF